jgi:hypothetical protein
MVLTSSVSASAAVVKFLGTLSSSFGTPSVALNLGNFSGELTILDRAAPFTSSQITGGKFVFNGNQVVTVTGGQISVGNGSVSFLITGNRFTPNFSENMDFSFTSVPNVVANGGINQTILNNLSQPNFLTASSFVFDDGVNGYGGSITAVPEPGSMALVAGLVLGAGGWKWRKRRLAVAKASA